MTSIDRDGVDLSGSLFEESDLSANVQHWPSGLSGKIIRVGIRDGAKHYKNEGKDGIPEEQCNRLTTAYPNGTSHGNMKAICFVHSNGKPNVEPNAEPIADPNVEAFVWAKEKPTRHGSVVKMVVYK